jgi:crotonobetainyl-CoA:carnitine CoA-transferase CaiB-like acyl-CoA transferase
MERLPLYSYRILDLTTSWPGAYATRLLADMGAEVIRVGQRDDLSSDVHYHVNRNKYSVTLDLDQAHGRELLLRLAALSDVVVEDRAKAPENAAFSYENLRSVKADIILVSLSDHDASDGTNPAPVSGIAAAGAAALALWHRRRAGDGGHVEVGRLETEVGLLGEHVVGYSMNRRLPQPTGDRHSSMAPHGCYPCASRERVTIAVENDEQFRALCRIMGRPELAADPRFADVVSRYRNQDELDATVEGWTQQLTAEAVTQALQAAGVAAAPVLGVPALFDDLHLRARGFWESVSHPDAGTWDVDGVPWRLSRSPAHIRLPAPRPGEHNEYVLRRLLGLSDEEMRELTG